MFLPQPWHTLPGYILGKNHHVWDLHNFHVEIQWNNIDVLKSLYFHPPHTHSLSLTHSHTYTHTYTLGQGVH